MRRSVFPPRAAARPSLRALSIAVFATLLTSPTAHPAAWPPSRGPQAMVVTEEPHATAVGLEILEAGGNAVDAAVAAALALAVTLPSAGNLGGGGFLLYRAAAGEAHALDFRETAPRALTPRHFVDPSGRVRSDKSLRGGLAVGVPGTPAGLYEAHRRWGSLPWPRLVAPAIRLAREGFRLPPATARRLNEHAGKLRGDPAAAAVFVSPSGSWRAGDRLQQPDLAQTLERLAASGPVGFYRGPVAEAIVEKIRREGGVLELRDLEGYTPKRRTPLRGRYRGLDIVTFPPPSSGGVALLQMLGMLEPYELSGLGFGASPTIHRIAEAMRRAFADRSRYLGDPDFVDVPVQELLHPDYLQRRSRELRRSRATPSRKVAPGVLAVPSGPHTTHLCVGDAQHRVVSLTTTLNQSYGSGLLADGTGVLLNNEMDDFSLAPGIPNTYGLVGGRANAVEPGKRPLSSMTPTLVEDPLRPRRPAMALGSPGGPVIITAVLLVILNQVDFGLPPEEAVAAPRFHHQWIPDEIRYETGAFPWDVRRALERRGHRLHAVDTLGNVSLIALDEDGAWLGVADPRKRGSAAGF